MSHWTGCCYLVLISHRYYCSLCTKKWNLNGCCPVFWFGCYSLLNSCAVQACNFSSYASLIYFKWMNIGTRVYQLSECIFVLSCGRGELKELWFAKNKTVTLSSILF